MPIEDSQLYIDATAISNVSPYDNPALTSVFGGIKVLDGVISVSNAALYTGGAYVTADHDLPVVSVSAKVVYPSDLQYCYIMDTDDDSGFALKGTGQLRLYALVAGELSGSPLTFGSTTLADGDIYTLQYDGEIITALKNGVEDFTFTATIANFHLGWNYNIDNVHAGGVSALGFDYSTGGGGGGDGSIDDYPASVQPGETYTLDVSGLGVWDTVTLGDKVLSFSGSDITVPFWQVGVEDTLNVGTDYTLTVTDEDGLVAFVDGVTYDLPDGYTHNQMGAGMTLDTGADSIAKTGSGIVSGSDVYVTALGGGILTNDGLFTDVPFGDYPDASSGTPADNEYQWRRGLDYVMNKFTLRYINTEA